MINDRLTAWTVGAKIRASAPAQRPKTKGKIEACAGCCNNATLAGHFWRCTGPVSRNKARSANGRAPANQSDALRFLPAHLPLALVGVEQLLAQPDRFRR